MEPPVETNVPAPARRGSARPGGSPPGGQAESKGPSPTRRPRLGPAEFDALYEEHSRFVYYLALRLLGDPTQAEDAAHDVFLKAFHRWQQFRGEAGVRTWLYRITINHCQNLLRRWQHRHVFSNLDEAFWDSAPARGDSPLRVLEIKELGQRIQRTLDHLPEEYRVLLLLVADEHLSYQEIAKLTEQSTDAVRGKLHRARKAFAAEFPKSA